MVTNSQQIGTVFGNYFSTVSKDGLQINLGVSQSQQCTVPRKLIENTIVISDVSIYEAAKIIIDLKNKNSVGVDKISQ